MPNFIILLQNAAFKVLSHPLVNWIRHPKTLNVAFWSRIIVDGIRPPKTMNAAFLSRIMKLGTIATRGH